MTDLSIPIFLLLYYYLLVRKYEYPYYADWYAISLRWLSLVGAVLSLVRSDVFNKPLLFTILASVLWNLLCTILTAFNRRMNAHRMLNVAFDFVIAVALFVFSQGMYGPLLWIGLLNMLSAGIYFGYTGSLIVAFIISLTQVLSSVFILHIPIIWQHAIWLTGYNLLAGLVFGVLSYKLYRQLRERYMGVKKDRMETDEQLRIGERNKMRNLFQLVDSINASLDFTIVLQSALDLSHDVLTEKESRKDALICAFLLFDGSTLKVSLERGMLPEDRRRVFLAEDGAFARAIRTGEIVRLDDPLADPELCQMASVDKCNSFILLPLRRGLDTYGIMFFAHEESDFFDEDRQDLLTIIGQQASIAIQNSLLFRDLGAERDRLVRTQEEERKIVARDLHDGPVQSITGIAMRAEYIRRMIREGIDNKDLETELEQIEVMARKTTQEIRGMLFSLRPLVLEKEGLHNALKTLAQNMKELYQQNVVLNVDQAIIAMFNSNKQKVIFQIIDEAVNNSRKHAHASLIQINLLPMPQTPEIGLLEVLDNGVGFDLKAVNGSYETSGSLGMITLRERAELINGRIKIESIPGKGTSVQVAIPLTDRATDFLHGGIHII